MKACDSLFSERESLPVFNSYSELKSEVSTQCTWICKWLNEVSNVYIIQHYIHNLTWQNEDEWYAVAHSPGLACKI